MRTWLLLIPFVAAVMLIIQSESPDSLAPAVEVSFQGAEDEATKSFRLIPAVNQVRVEFNDLRDVWGALPGASQFSSAHQDGLLKLVAINESSAGFKRTGVKRVPRSLLRGMGDLAFTLPESACRYLMSKPISFSCELAEGKEALAMTWVQGVPVALMSLSSGLINTGLLDQDGLVGESSVYAIKVKLSVGSSRIYDFVLYASTDMVHRFYPDKISKEEIIVSHKTN